MADRVGGKIMNGSVGSGSGRDVPDFNSGRITLAFVVHKTEQRRNRARYEAAARARGCCSIAALRAKVIGCYNNMQRYSHCEVGFPLVNGGDKVLAFASFSDKGVVKMSRTFSNTSYQYLHLTVTREQMIAAYKFGTSQVGAHYDGRSASWRLICCPPTVSRGGRRASDSSWWCASLAHAILQHAGFLVHYRLNTLDVDDIVDTMEHSLRTTEGATPYVLGRALDGYEEDMFLSTTRGIDGAARVIADMTTDSCREVFDI